MDADTQRMYELNKTIIPTLSDVTDTLHSNFQVTPFTYRRFYNDNRLFHITTNKEWLEHAYPRSLFHSVESNEKLRYVMKQKKEIFLWSGNKDDPLFKDLYDFNIWNGITFYETQEDFTEVIAFSSTVNNHHAYNFYINNIDFINFYKEIFKQNILRQLEKLDIYKHTIKIEERKTKNLSLGHHEKIKKIINDITLNKYKLKLDGNEINLTFREIECLYQLSKGKSSKDIARVLDISPRTVEHYINIIKNKTRMPYKGNIINSFNESQHIDFFDFFMRWKNEI